MSGPKWWTRWSTVAAAGLVAIVIGMFDPGGGFEHRQVLIGGRVVVNAVDTIRQADATQLPQAGGGRCYFVTGQDASVACGPVQPAGTPAAWDVYPVMTAPVGAGVAVTGLGSLGTGAASTLAPGVGLVEPDGWAGTVGADGFPSVRRPYNAVAWMWTGVVFTGLAALVAGAVVTRVRWVRVRPPRPPRRVPAPPPVPRVDQTWINLARMVNAPPIVPPPRPASPPGFWPGPPPRDDPPAATPPVDGNSNGTGVPGKEEGEPRLPLEWVERAASETAEPVPVADAVTVDQVSVVEPADDEVASWSGPAVLFMGPVMAVGWSRDPDRQVLTEVAAYLAVHQDRSVGTDELREAIWSESRVGDRAVSRDTVGQTVSRLRRCLGVEHLPEATAGSGYRMAPTVSSDWFRFQALVEAARHSDDEHGAEVLRRALGLVRGRPFAGVAPKTYGWVWEGLVVAEMEAAISEAAGWASRLFLNADQPRLAEWAARRGLLAVPFDESLYSARLAALAAGGDRSGFRRAWRDATEALGEQAAAGPVGKVHAELALLFS